MSPLSMSPLGHPYHPLVTPITPGVPLLHCTVVIPEHSFGHLFLSALSPVSTSASKVIGTQTNKPLT